MNAALYVRKSTKHKQKNSVQVQTDAMRQYCSGFYTIERIFQDEESGRNLERPGLNSAIEWLSEEEGRVLIFYKVDRYARSIDRFKRIRPFIESGQVKFMDIGLPSDKQDMLMIQFKLMFAEHESRLLGQRVSATIKHIEKTTGKKWGLTDKARAKGREASAKVRAGSADAFGKKLLNALSAIDRSSPQGRILNKDKVDILNGLGFTTPRGNNWSEPSLSRTLKRLSQRGVTI
jgi:DNA invertase Pin-like site-specific DNA recombinase